MLNTFLDDAIRVARKAGTVLRTKLESDFRVEYKGEVDLVTDMDRTAQTIIESEIRSLYPTHGLLAEEELDDPGTDGYVWVIDPLDGTTNYAHRFPVFSVSIALTAGEEVLCGVVHNPMSEETFTSVKGGGASLNGHAIGVSKVDTLNRSLLATGFPYNIRETLETNLNHFNNMVLQAQGIRRCGSAALDLCYVACGRVDGFWELGLNPWDIAAGTLIVREAGGMVTDFSGKPLVLDGSEVLASNGVIHNEMTAVLAADRPGQG
ncbi:MAG: inositol monophosphatase [bacterium]|nr:MAG: inositol monophosphatase [bacterium]